MLMERQLNFLMNAKLNEKFPPFLNKGTLGLNFGLQGLVFSATSTTAECQTLANPMYVHSIPCNNDNQDVVSMGTNAAVLARKVIANTYEVQAILSASIAQAIDIADNKENLSSSTVGLYQKVRSVFPCVEEDVPMFKEVEELTKILKRK
jgi:histidine ammonia-lyase